MLKFVFVSLILSFCTLTFPQDRPHFDQQKIKVHGHPILVEVAKTNEERSYGLMFKKQMDANKGMLFIFEDERILSFWMKNTLIPLSVGFFNKSKRLVDIQDMKVEPLGTNHYPAYPSSGPAKYALEVNQGWFKKNNISPGAMLDLGRAPRKASPRKNN